MLIAPFTSRAIDEAVEDVAAWLGFGVNMSSYFRVLGWEDAQVIEQVQYIGGPGRGSCLWKTGITIVIYRVKGRGALIRKKRMYPSPPQRH